MIMLTICLFISLKPALVISLFCRCYDFFILSSSIYLVFLSFVYMCYLSWGLSKINSLFSFSRGRKSCVHSTLLKPTCGISLSMLLLILLGLQHSPTCLNLLCVLYCIFCMFNLFIQCKILIWYICFGFLLLTKNWALYWLLLLMYVGSSGWLFFCDV